MGAPLDREACLRYQELLTPRIFNGYGTTEAFWNTFLRPSDLPEHAGSAGRACTDDDVAVVRIYEDRHADPDDHAAQDGTEVGEVIVRSVKSGYAYVNQPEEQAARFRDGWLYIGDLATWDEDEYVTIVGPQGRHDHLRRRERAPDPGRGGARRAPRDRRRRPSSACPTSAGASWSSPTSCPPTTELDAAACEAHCSGHPMLAAFKRPRAYRFVDELPMTATGKKLHYQVREQARRTPPQGLLPAPVSSQRAAPRPGGHRDRRHHAAGA